MLDRRDTVVVHVTARTCDVHPRAGLKQTILYRKCRTEETTESKFWIDPEQIPEFGFHPKFSCNIVSDEKCWKLKNK